MSNFYLRVNFTQIICDLIIFFNFCRTGDVVEDVAEAITLLNSLMPKSVVFLICIAVLIKSYQMMSNSSLIHHKKSLFDVTAGISFLDFLHCNAIP